LRKPSLLPDVSEGEFVLSSGEDPGGDLKTIAVNFSAVILAEREAFLKPTCLDLV
jgi:hypothetical protein